ncbi:hypothetical protein FJ656_10550 [Schumannella luteola]|nr:hypothetical protein FJ656_10550 [Schumannella luteola]
MSDPLSRWRAGFLESARRDWTRRRPPLIGLISGVVIVALSTLVTGGRSWISSLVFIAVMVAFWIGGRALARKLDRGETDDRGERDYPEGSGSAMGAAPAIVPAAPPTAVRAAAPPLSAYQRPAAPPAAAVAPIPEMTSSPWAKHPRPTQD